MTKSKFCLIQPRVRLFKSMDIVIGPTPPGTGVIFATLSNILSLKTQSPYIISKEGGV